VGKGLALGLALTLGGCVAQSQAEGPPLVRASPIELEGERADLARLGRLAFESGFVLSARDPRFGGLSGVWLAPDGARLIAVSDRGTLWSASLDHAADGRLLGLGGWQAIEPGTDGGAESSRDAEALAPDGAGGLVIAYEGTHRLDRLALDDLSAPPSALPLPPALERPTNAGIEALVDLPDGALLALAEGVFDPSGELAAWRIEGERVLPLSYAASDGYVPTGADRLDGVVYVVERRFSLLGGFATRIVSLQATAVNPGARLVGQSLAELAPPLIGENFEAIAVRRGPGGQVLLYLLSDDNFTVLQRTVLLQLSLAGSASGGERVDRAHQRPEG
jgi:hypothetical protein